MTKLSSPRRRFCDLHSLATLVFSPCGPHTSTPHCKDCFWGGKERRRWLTDNGGPGLSIVFALFDIYRVLRPGGVFWLDCLFCLGSQLNGTYVPILDRVSFRLLRWKTGRQLDRGAERNEWYVSALLEKPMT